MKILSKYLKLIASELIQFEDRHTKNINWTFLHVQLSDIPIWKKQSEFVPTMKLSSDVTANSHPDRQNQYCFSKKVKLEHQDNLTLRKLLPKLANRDSKSISKNNSHAVRKQPSASSKKISIYTLEGKLRG